MNQLNAPQSKANHALPQVKPGDEPRRGSPTIRRYIQLDRGEDDTALDCKLYFPNLNTSVLEKRAYVEIFEQVDVSVTIDKFTQHPAVWPILDRTPDYFLGYVTVVW